MFYGSAAELWAALDYDFSEENFKKSFAEIAYLTGVIPEGFLSEDKTYGDIIPHYHPLF